MKATSREKRPTVTPEAEPAGRAQNVAVVHGRCTHRDPDDDFFCLRYQVWYPSIDCAVRTRFRTCAGCRDCDQGRFNLKRHAAALLRVRPLSSRA